MIQNASDAIHGALPASPRLQIAFGLTALILFATVSASANVSLPALLADHMVVQRGLPVRVWGMAARHESVAVTLRGETKSATADDLGRWSVSLSPGEATAPRARGSRDCLRRED
jgi:sialate O-acetylesterase